MTEGSYRVMINRLDVVGCNLNKKDLIYKAVRMILDVSGS